MKAVFTEMDCEHVRDVTVTSRRGNQEQKVFMNRNGVFRVTDPDGGADRIMRLPSIKVWVFCSLICDMLADEDISKQRDERWEVNARDDLGRRFFVKGYAVSFRSRPKYDPSEYLRKATGINDLWMLDGKKAG